MFNFGPKEVYITKTIKEMSTTKYLDPNTVVTFSVKGCRPSRLPFDLPECDGTRHDMPHHMESTEKGVIVMAPIQFVPSVITPNKTIEAAKVEKKPEEVKKDETEKEKEPEKKEKKS